MVSQPDRFAGADSISHVAAPGETVTISIGFENHGPDPAVSAYVNAYIPSGVPLPLIEMTQADLDALAATVVPDGLGNTAFLYVDDLFCEDLLFQIQEDDGDPANAPPIVGLDVGTSSAVTFDLSIPMGPPEIASLIIDDPPALAGEFKAAKTLDQWVNASDWGRYTRTTCDPGPTPCGDLDLCFGPRLPYIDPIISELELVDDGSADPTFGCDPLIGFTPGRIAVIKRGSCEFGQKALNAEEAGAQAVILVNNELCADFPDSTKCALNMGAGTFGGQVDIPMVMLSMDDGQPLIDALAATTVVHGRLGPVGEVLTLDSLAFVTGVPDSDPDPTNDVGTFDLDVSGIFIDGFESGGTLEWSNTAP